MPLARQAFAPILVAYRPCIAAGVYLLPFSIDLLLVPRGKQLKLTVAFSSRRLLLVSSDRGGNQRRSLFGSGRARRRRPQLRSRRSETAKSVFIDEAISS
jgi:hypothetical protein